MCQKLTHNKLMVYGNRVLKISNPNNILLYNIHWSHSGYPVIYYSLSISTLCYEGI